MALLDHIAFVVRSLDDARADCAARGLPLGPVQRFDSEGTAECYVGEGAGRILLIEPVAAGPYRDALEKRGPGMHHVALNVPNLDAFCAERVDGSGWLLHPRSLATRSGGTIWLARPGVEVLVEVHEADREPADLSVVDRVVVAGLDTRNGLGELFAGTEAPVVAGNRSNIVVAGRSFGGGAAALEPDDVFAYNQKAWDEQVRRGNQWTVPVSAEDVARASDGDFTILLTPARPVPNEWFGDLEDLDILCLASGGGQQGPILAAAGANVTVFDASAAQLDRDREVAAREGLTLRTVQGDMKDLSAFADQSFDLIVHPCSNCFVPDVRPVWREAFRVLRPGGHLLSGFNNPTSYCFDWGSVERGTPQLRYALPYSDLEHPDDPFVAKARAAGDPIEFGHSLDDQIAGQIDAGFVLVGFFEDMWGSGYFPDDYFPGFIATRARRP